MNRYKHIFFDLDHTLWDFDHNSKETLLELFSEYQLGNKLSCPPDVFVEAYALINAQLWHLYNIHKISKEDLRSKRFQLLLHQFNYSDDLLALKLDREYIRICPEKTQLVNGSIDILDFLKEKYVLHIITNGFLETQIRKLKSARLMHYFQSITTSECSGFNKPERKMFTFALNRANAGYKESIIVGDNLNTDIRGAKSVGMDQVYFNPDKKPHQHKVTFEVYALSDLKELF